MMRWMMKVDDEGGWLGSVEDDFVSFAYCTMVNHHLGENVLELLPSILWWWWWWWWWACWVQRWSWVVECWGWCLLGKPLHSPPSTHGPPEILYVCRCDSRRNDKTYTNIYVICIYIYICICTKLTKIDEAWRRIHETSHLLLIGVCLWSVYTTALGGGTWYLTWQTSRPNQCLPKVGVADLQTDGRRGWIVGYGWNHNMGKWSVKGW